MAAAGKYEGKYFQIVVKGHLEAEMSEWFNSMTIKNTPAGEAVLSGYIIDQSALHGLLIKIQDLGLPLLAVNSIETEDGPNQTK